MSMAPHQGCGFPGSLVEPHLRESQFGPILLPCQRFISFSGPLSLIYDIMRLNFLPAHRACPCFILKDPGSTPGKSMPLDWWRRLGLKDDGSPRPQS